VRANTPQRINLDTQSFSNEARTAGRGFKETSQAGDQRQRLRPCPIGAKWPTLSQEPLSCAGLPMACLAFAGRTKCPEIIYVRHVPAGPWSQTGRAFHLDRSTPAAYMTSLGWPGPHRGDSTAGRISGSPIAGHDLHRGRLNGGTTAKTERRPRTSPTTICPITGLTHRGHPFWSQPADGPADADLIYARPAPASLAGCHGIKGQSHQGIATTAPPQSRTFFALHHRSPGTPGNRAGVG